MAKRLCVDDDEDGRKKPKVSKDSRDTVNNPSPVIPGIDINRNVAKSGSERTSGLFPIATHPPVKVVAQDLDQLRKEVKDKTETLRRLKMVQMYRSKVNQQEYNLCYCTKANSNAHLRRNVTCLLSLSLE